MLIFLCLGFADWLTWYDVIVRLLCRDLPFELEQDTTLEKESDTSWPMPTERDSSNAELVLYFSLDKVLDVVICVLIASNMTASFPRFHSSIAKRIYLNFTASKADFIC